MAFTGMAVYSPDVFDSIAEDVSKIIGMISPSETPTLDLIGDPDMPAENVVHEWLEDALAPTKLVLSSSLASSTSDTSVGISNGAAAQMRVGTIVTNDFTEYMRISVINGNTITLERGFGGTTSKIASMNANDVLEVISDAALEGDDVNQDTSKGQTRKSNICQIIKKDVIISGTMQSVRRLGGVVDSFSYEVTKRTAEALVNLNRDVLTGILSGNTIGSATAVRTMRGVWSFLTTNVQSVAVWTDSLLNDLIGAAWTNGGTDINMLICDSVMKRQIDALMDSRIRVDARESTFRTLVTEYEGTYGRQSVVLDRWMPNTSTLAVATNRIKVVPLRGRSFHVERVAKTGDADKGFIVGEYTVELKNEEGMARADKRGV